MAVLHSNIACSKPNDLFLFRHNKEEHYVISRNIKG